MSHRAWKLWAAVLALALGAALPARAADTPSSLTGVSVVAADEVSKLIDAGATVIDTRVSAEYARKTIKGARSVPYKESSVQATAFDARLDEFDLSKLPGDKAVPLVFFCNAGECWKSYKAAAVASRAGYTRVSWFRGGLPEWSARGLPTQ